MSILSDGDIEKRLINGGLRVFPINRDNIQPASVDLELHWQLKKLNGEEIDLRKEPYYYYLQPGEFILGSTLQHVEIPNDLVAQVDGKSSIARLGVKVHETAGYIDPGFKGNITLEIHNDGEQAFKLSWDMKICQIIFATLSSPCIKPYGHRDNNNHYQDSKGTVLSKHGD